jgi:hypothetical protein
VFDPVGQVMFFNHVRFNNNDVYKFFPFPITLRYTVVDRPVDFLHEAGGQNRYR